MDIIAIDEQLFIYLNNLGTPAWDNFWLAITNKVFWIPLYLLLIYFIVKKFGWKHTVVICVVAALMIVSTDQISHLFKDTLIQRLRPCKDPDIYPYMRLVKSYCGGQFGFFSGHATNHMGIAIFMGLLFHNTKWVLPIMVIWAIFIAYSRVYIGVHYPLDILTGMLMGGLIANFFYQLQKYLYIQLIED